MVLFLFLLSIEILDTIELNKEFNTIEIYKNNIYLAPFTGKSIYIIDSIQNVRPITFTDDENYRIYDFYITPFVIYFNNGNAIEKFYLSSGIKESVYSYKYITSFSMTSSEDVVFSDEQKRELFFLDFTNSVKFKKVDLSIKDLYIAGNVIHLLTRNKLIFCDEHGNIFREETIPEKFDKIFADATTIILFSLDEKYLYIFSDRWERIELIHGIRDITANDEIIVILGENGTTLYIYSKSNS